MTNLRAVFVLAFASAAWHAAAWHAAAAAQPRPESASTPSAAASAPSAPPPSLPQRPVSDEAFVETLKSRLAQVETLVGADDATKARLREIYQQAIGEVEAAIASSAKLAKDQATTAHAATRIEQARAELASVPSAPDVLVPETVTVSEIEQAIANRESELNGARATLEKAEAEPRLRAKLRGDLPGMAAAARQRLTAVNAELQSLIGGNDNPLRAASRALAWAQRRNLEQKLLCFDQQLAMYEATADLLPLERDLAARRVALAEQGIAMLMKIVNGRRQQEAENQVAKATVEAETASPAIQLLAEENSQIAEQRKALAQRITVATKGLEATNRELAAVKAGFKRSREKVEAVGLSNAIGMLLRKQRELLPYLGHRKRAAAVRQQEIADERLTILQLGDSRAELADCEPKVREALTSLGANVFDDNQRAELERQVRESLRLKKEYLDALIADHNAYFDKLVELDNAERQLIDQTEQCAQYIDERVLWIASDPPFEAGDLRIAGDAFWWLVKPDSCAELGRTLAADARRNPALPIAAVLALAALGLTRGRMRGRLALLGERAAKGSCWRFLPTFEALAITALLAAFYPAAAAYAGWRLYAAIDATDACKAVGLGLLVSARVFLALEFLRIACRPRGLALAHFDWPQSAATVLGRNAAWLRIAIVPAVFAAVAMSTQPNDRWDGALGRIGFLAALAMCCVFLHFALNPRRGALVELLERRGDWSARLRYVWYAAALTAPAALGIAAVVGYFYTAEQLAERLASSAYLLLALVLVRAMLLRWIRVNRRKLAIEEARKRRAAELEGAAEEGGSEVALPPEPGRDLEAINTQTRRFVEYSLLAVSLLAAWLVWADVTPALGALNRIELWQVTEQAVNDGKTIERVVGTVTLGGAIVALLVFFGAFLASKNLPGLLEMAVLQHLPLDAGARYAVTTVSRYVILVLGIFASCGIVGLGWAKVQWLAAAFGVGLGFGLQEIFANFISGLIILFERPIRVGDVITVDGTTGAVSKIRMRATTIVDGDRKELIVPNKTFITGQVLNWTLSDPVNRVTINVGIAYGADTQRASELLLKAAKEHPLVLDEPAPRVAMEGFGDSSLNFVLRCFLPNMENRQQVIHELHMAIEREFREAGIEIPFPQTELHIRNLDALTEAAQPNLPRAA